jgi:hypothetical protein
MKPIKMPKPAKMPKVASEGWIVTAKSLSDSSELPMTIVATTDPDMPFLVKDFSRITCGLPLVSQPYKAQALVTLLPVTYFRGR